MSDSDFILEDLLLVIEGVQLAKADWEQELHLEATKLQKMDDSMSYEKALGQVMILPKVKSKYEKLTRLYACIGLSADNYIEKLRTIVRVEDVPSTGEDRRRKSREQNI